MFSKRLIIALVATGLSGCGATTNFEGLAYNYNTVAGDLNDRLLLLNVVRTSYSSSVQFTNVSSVTGAQSANAGFDFSSPITTQPVTRTGGLNGGGSETSTITNAIVDTKEFYAGVKAAIPGPIINSYFQEYYPGPILFNLFFDRITIASKSARCSRRETLPDCTRNLRNHAKDPRAFGLYQAFMHYLFHIGFFTEAVHINRPSKDTKSDDADKASNTPDAVHVCFRPVDPIANSLIVDRPHTICSPEGTRRVSSAEFKQFEQASIRIAKPFASQIKQMLNNVPPRSGDALDPDETNESIFNSFERFAEDDKVVVSFHVRSTLGMIEFLGSIVSAARAFGKAPAIDLDKPRSSNYTACVDPEVAIECTPIFIAETNSASPGLTVAYNGRTYTIPEDVHVSGASSYVLAIARQLVALNTSSKDLPASNTLTLVP